MNKKLNLWALVALVVSPMIGAGVFSLPQNMAEGASAGSIVLGWGITGVGMLCLVLVFQSLALRKPDLDSGIFSYAQDGFGEYIGFNAAWGYWLTQILANVSYAVVVFSALSYFTDSIDSVIFGNGNTFAALIAGSALIWGIFFLVVRGVNNAALVNLVTTLAKLLPLVVFIVAVILAFHMDTFTFDFWGEQTPELGSVLDQVKSTMLVTLWVFIGVEGAVVVSSRAKKRSDIGKATIIGFLSALAIYIMITLFSFGVMQQGELAQLQNPSMAGILESVVGPWGAALINGGLIISVCGALLSWTVLSAEVPYVAAKRELFPKIFLKENKAKSPYISLFFTTLLVQGFLILTHIGESTYIALVNIATTAALLPYALCGAYMLKLVITGDSYLNEPNQRKKDGILAFIATVYGLWLVYAAGIDYVMLLALLYAPGIPMFISAKKGSGWKWALSDKLFAVVLTIGFIAAIYMICNGNLNIF